MKLSEEQIQELYKFTRKHYVEHHDLRIELVDHMANGIEQQWQENPERTFKDALLREFRKFGVGGFEKVVSRRKSAMAKRYRSFIFRFFKEYFKLPKIVFIISAIVIIGIVFRYLSTPWKYEIILGLFYLLVFSIFVIYFRRRSSDELEQVKGGKKWVLKDQIYAYTQFANVLNFIPLTLSFSFVRHAIPMDSILVDFLFSTLLIFLSVLSYIMIFVIPKKAEELLLETYPEYNMA